MGRIKITEKPGVWPYILINDFKNPPYFAYEFIDDSGNKKYIPVRKGDVDDYQNEHRPTSLRSSSIRYLTDKRKGVVSQFLRETIEQPMKYGTFRSQHWNQEFFKFLAKFEYFEANEKILDSWLKDSNFQNLIKEIREKQPESTEKTEMEVQIQNGIVTRSLFRRGLENSSSLHTVVSTASSSESSSSSSTPALSKATSVRGSPQPLPSTSSTNTNNDLVTSITSSSQPPSSSSPLLSQTTSVRRFSQPLPSTNPNNDLVTSAPVRRSTRKRHGAKCVSCSMQC